MNTKFAHTLDEEKIQPAINNEIDAGDIVIVEDKDKKKGKMIFINEDGEQIPLGAASGLIEGEGINSLQ
jgi:hypothetical protein